MKDRGKKTLTIFFLPAAKNCGELCWQPPADVYRARDGWLIKFDLAGVRPEDIRVRVEGSRLLVSGTRRDLILEEGLSYYSMEIAYSRFERGLELPFNLDHAQVSSEYREGMLLVRIVPEGERP